MTTRQEKRKERIGGKADDSVTQLQEGGEGGMKRRVGERARKDGDGQCRLVYQSCIVEESLPFSTLLLCWLHPTAPTARSFLSPAPFLLLSSVLSLFLPVVARPRAATKKRRTPPRVRVLDLVPRLSLLKKPIVLERKKERNKGRKKGRKEGTGRVYIVLYLEKERNRSNRFFLSLSFPFPLN